MFSLKKITIHAVKDPFSDSYRIYNFSLNSENAFQIQSFNRFTKSPLKMLFHKYFLSNFKCVFIWEELTLKNELILHKIQTYGKLLIKDGARTTANHEKVVLNKKKNAHSRSLKTWPWKYFFWNFREALTFSYGCTELHKR